MSSNLTLRKFDPRKMERQRIDPKKGPPTVLLIGSKRTGKSTLMQCLIYYLRKIPSGIIVTGSLNSAEQFSSFFPQCCIFNTLDKSMTERISSIMDQQEEMNEKHKQKYGQNSKKSKKYYSTMILMDDCGYDTSYFRGNKVINRLFMNGRHYNVLNIISLQYCKSIPPDLRKNADYVFIMREPSIKERKKLHDEFAGIVPTFSNFCSIMDSCTENYQCLVIDKTVVQSNKLSDNIFFFKADYPPRKFKACCKDIWEYNEQFFKKKIVETVGAKASNSARVSPSDANKNVSESNKKKQKKKKQQQRKKRNEKVIHL